MRAIEKKPATAAALEKYLGSGLIKGVGPQIAKRIVDHFKDRTLDVFESAINDLLRVPGIAEKKLEQIKTSWSEHRAIRDVMIFLQGYGISLCMRPRYSRLIGDRGDRSRFAKSLSARARHLWNRLFQRGPDRAGDGF